MRAVQFSEYGSAEQLRVADVPAPEPGRGQVRVAVRAAGVNPLDWKIRLGLMTAVYPVDLPHVPGVELAGVVDAVGEGTGFKPGDEVFGWSDSGTYAEYALASVLAAKPADLSWADAATLPIAGETALRGLNLLDVAAGETLLVNGASGVVGGLAVQLAVARGAVVIGTAGESGDAYVRSLGAVPVRYGEGLAGRVRALAPQGVDAVFDAAGYGALPDAIELRGGTDRILSVADPAAFDLGVAFSSDSTYDPAVLADLAEQVTSGKLTIAHAVSHPLDAAAEAHRLSETGHSGGKITLAIG